jgi:hypothetical protein
LAGSALKVGSIQSQLAVFTFSIKSTKKFLYICFHDQTNSFRKNHYCY